MSNNEVWNRCAQSFFRNPGIWSGKNKCIGFMGAACAGILLILKRSGRDLFNHWELSPPARFIIFLALARLFLAIVLWGSSCRTFCHAETAGFNFPCMA